jgi:arylsulfatase A-like enzyme
MFRFLIVFLLIVAASDCMGQYTAAKKKPNIIVILADDMGYSDIGSFGSEIKTPNLDALAREGLRMTQFYNAARCCPTRASLLTGVYQHQAGVGHMVNERPIPAYRGYLSENCVTIAEVLKNAGYATYMTGKWHVGEKRPHWPLDRGFDRYFGLINGANSYFENRPYRPRQKLTIALDNEPHEPGEGYYSTDAYTDYAMKFLDENKGTGKPFFLYLAYQAPHWPLHALKEDIAKYEGRYKEGWDKLREERFRRMKQIGVLDKSAKLSQRNGKVPAWDSVSKEEKERWTVKMAVYAAMIDRMDQNIGRLQNKLKEIGEDQNTMIIFLSDNGGSYEQIGGQGFTPEIIAANKLLASEPGSFTAYEFPGANVSNTPFRYFKRYVYEGGIATPFVAYFPGVIKAGRTSSQPAHITDIMATILDVTGIPYPETYNGNSITPAEGFSMKPLFEGKKWERQGAIFFEHEGNRAVRQGDWKLVSEYPQNRWQLYNLKTDRSELTDLSAQYPNKVAEMEALYEVWAKRAGVVPFAQIDSGIKD